MKIEEAIRQKPFTDTYHRATVNLFYTAAQVQEKLHTFLVPYGLTTQQFNVLRILRGQGDKAISAKAIRERMLDRQSDISRLLGRLKRNKWVEIKSSRTDRRASEVKILPAALHLLDQLDRPLMDLNRQLIHLSEEDCKQFNDLLDQLRG